MDWCLNDSKCNKDEVVKRLNSIIKEELKILELKYEYLKDKIIEKEEKKININFVKDKQKELETSYEQSIENYKRLNKFINLMSLQYPTILQDVKLSIFEQKVEEKEKERKRNNLLDTIELVYASYKLNDAFEKYMDGGFKFKTAKIQENDNEKDPLIKLLNQFNTENVLSNFLTNPDYRGLLDHLLVFKFTVTMKTIYNDKFLLPLFRTFKKIEVTWLRFRFIS